MKKIKEKILIIKEEEIKSTIEEQSLAQIVLVESDGCFKLYKARSYHDDLAGGIFSRTVY